MSGDQGAGFGRVTGEGREGAENRIPKLVTVFAGDSGNDSIFLHAKDEEEYVAHHVLCVGGARDEYIRDCEMAQGQGRQVHIDRENRMAAESILYFLGEILG